MLVAIGLVIAFVLVAFFVWRNGDTRACRWRADRNGDADGLHLYRCAICGAEVLNTKDAPPNACHANRS